MTSPYLQVTCNFNLNKDDLLMKYEDISKAYLIARLGIAV